MKPPSVVERQLRMSVEAPRMLDALHTVLPMLRLQCERLGPFASSKACPADIRSEYDAWLLCMITVESAIEAADPQPKNLLKMVTKEVVQ